MKKILSVILVVSMLLCILAAFPGASFAQGAPAGDAVSTVDDFKNMASDGTYYLANNIDFGEEVFGNYIYNGAFKGTLDGNGYSLLNVKISAGGNCGIFHIDFSGTLKNLTIGSDKTPASVKSTGDGSAVAVVACTAVGNARFENVTVYADISGNRSKTGMFTGYVPSGANLTFENCTTYGSVTGQPTAGFVATNCSNSPTITFKGCTNNANITNAVSNSSPVAGFYSVHWDGNDGTPNLTFENCVNNGNVTSHVNDRASAAGFVCGNTPMGITASFTNCVNNGDITGGDCVAAGFFVIRRDGENDQVNTISLDKCVNNGTITCTYNNGNEKGSAAGLVALPFQAAAVVTINRSVNNGTVNSGMAAAGGLFTVRTNVNSSGRYVSLKMFGCINTGDVTAQDWRAGGIVGAANMNSQSPVVIDHCYNVGSVTNTGGGGGAGGLFSIRVDSNNSGHPCTINILNSVNTGDVSATNWRAGGIGGILGMHSDTSYTVDHCYNVGSVTNHGGGGNACGIVGEMSQMGSGEGVTRVVSNCYNLGTITGNSSEITRKGWGETERHTVKNCFYTVSEARAIEGDVTLSNVGYVADAATLLTTLAALEPENAEVIFVADSQNINGGYPVLSWQVVEDEPEAPETEAPEIPEEPLLLKTDKTEYAVGESVKVTAIGSGKDWVGIYYVGDPHSIRWVYVETVGSGVEFDVWADTEDNGSSPATLEEGRYIIRLMPDDTSDLDKALAEIEITVGDPADTPVIGDASRFSIEKTEFTVGEAIKVTAVGSGTDWVGIYRMNEQDSMCWVYVETVGSGVEFDVWTQTQDNGSSPATLGEGTYIIRLMPNDQTDHGLAVASVIITVTKPDAPEIPEAPAFSEGAITETADGEYTVDSDDFSAFISSKRSSSAGHNDLRIVLAANYDKLLANADADLVIKFLDGEGNTVKTLTQNVVNDLKVYASATAAGNTYTADEGAVLFGIVIQNVPNNAWASVEVSLATAEGEIAKGAQEAANVITPDAPEAICIDDLPNKDVRFYAFERPSEWVSMGSPIGLIYYFEDKAGTGHHTAFADGIANGSLKIVLTANGTEYVINNFANGAPYFRFDVESAGLMIYSGVEYTMKIEAFNNNGDLVYYTKEFIGTSSITSSGAPARAPMNITLPEGLTKLSVSSSSSEGIDHWGDGPVQNLFDGDTQGTKIGGGKNGTPTVYFTLSEAATVSYFTFTTGGDTGSFTDRNPYGFILYGKVGEEWVVLSDIRDNQTKVTGFEPADATPYSYAVTNPQEATEYKVVFLTGGSFQLNELELYAE